MHGASGRRAASYAKQIEQMHDRLLGRRRRAHGEDIQLPLRAERLRREAHAGAGFAARAAAARSTRIWPDTDQHLDTNNSAIFLGLEDQTGGLRADIKLRGENIVVGVIDSGVAPNHPSLLDTEERDPARCRGHWATDVVARADALQRLQAPSAAAGRRTTRRSASAARARPGPGFEAKHCNNKVVGARFYLDGFLCAGKARRARVSLAARRGGHGTHVATIVAGNAVDASLFGTRVARVKRHRAARAGRDLQGLLGGAGATSRQPAPRRISRARSTTPSPTA